jgi:cellulose biosynthesis protein BcsQ
VHDPDPVRVLRAGGRAAADQQHPAGEAAPEPALDVTTVLLTMYDRRTRLADAVEQDVRAHFGDKVLTPSSRATCGCRRRRATGSPS